jgi:predicted DNA binding CopG/RHH family protein
MQDDPKLKLFPRFESDEEAERFVDEADLSEYDFSGFKRMQLEFKAKTATVSMRMSEDLLAAVKRRAKEESMPYQRFIRMALEQALAAGKRQG